MIKAIIFQLPCAVGVYVRHRSVGILRHFACSTAKHADNPFLFSNPTPNRQTKDSALLTTVRFLDIIDKKGGVKMGVLYDNFKDLKKQSQKDWFADKIGVVKFELNGKNYENVRSSF